jgi:hypothetical protein
MYKAGLLKGAKRTSCPVAPRKSAMYKVGIAGRVCNFGEKWSTCTLALSTRTFQGSAVSGREPPRSRGVSRTCATLSSTGSARALSSSMATWLNPKNFAQKYLKIRSGPQLMRKARVLGCMPKPLGDAFPK